MKQMIWSLFINKKIYKAVNWTFKTGKTKKKKKYQRKKSVKLKSICKIEKYQVR